MTETLTKNSQIVQETLDKHGLQYKVAELPSSTRTALDAANSIGCDISQIVKSLIFKTTKTNRPVLVLASGPNRVDEKKLKLHIAEEIAKADADFTKEITGFTIGGIPPIGHKNAIDLIFIDKSLLQYNEVWAAAGTSHSVFSINPHDLCYISNGKIIDIKS